MGCSVVKFKRGSSENYFKSSSILLTEMWLLGLVLVGY